ncbi:DsbA family protein [Cytophagaceae bacterium ABcell3]|nr:DsbA family protein [Cytophagaceae bacterium ABcell3]
MGDHDTLVQLGSEVGLPPEEITTMLNSDQYAYEVKSDILEARNLGINSVPFFVINRKYGIPGAQPEEAFLQALEEAWKEMPEPKNINSQEGNACNGGSCDI